MKIWAKYLIIGWSIVTFAIVIVSYQLTKSWFTEYEIMAVYKVPEKMATTNNAPGWEVVAKDLFYIEGDPLALMPGSGVEMPGVGVETTSITKDEFLDKMKKAKGITIRPRTNVKDESIYLFLPLYAFAVWMLPVLVFSLVGLLFSRNDEVR